ncbi:MAG UNVERIFIED_CONTAM: SH3 domain-containing protein [Anaerolineae bacterium]
MDFSDIIVLAPTTRVEVLGQSSDGRWYNVLMNDGQEGWVAASLLSLLPTPTPPVMLFRTNPHPCERVRHAPTQQRRIPRQTGTPLHRPPLQARPAR